MRVVYCRHGCSAWTVFQANKSIAFSEKLAKSAGEEFQHCLLRLHFFLPLNKTYGLFYPFEKRFIIHRSIAIKWDRQNCGRHLLEASCYTVQMQMLDIICSYLHGEHLEDADVILKPAAFVKVFRDMITDIVDTGLLQVATEIFEKKSLPTFNEKHRILELFNGRTENRSIHSMPIESLMRLHKDVRKKVKEKNGRLVYCDVCIGFISFQNAYFSTIRDGCI